MLIERTELLIKEGQEDLFAAAMSERGIKILSTVPNVIAVHFGRGVENPNKFILMIQWKDMDAHTAYNKTPVSIEIRELIIPFSKGASMEHFQMI